jgi:RND family efflux transporter MFP subunit
MKKKRIWTIVAIALMLVLIVFRLASNKRKIEANKKIVPQAAATAIPVNVDTVKYMMITDKLLKTGNLIPWQEANLTATSAGNLQFVHFDVGTMAHAGEMLAQVDTRMLQLKLEAARLQEQKLASDYQRYNTLLKGDATTETNVRDIKFNLDNTRNQISQLQKQISDNQIKAPFSGQIVQKSADQGIYVNPGTVLGKIVDISKLRAALKVTEAEVYKLHNGQKVNITTDIYPERVFTGQVNFISQQGDAAHNYDVQIVLDNSTKFPLKAGTYIYVDFIQNSKHSALQIPRSAIVESLQNPYVYLVENNHAVKRNITVGKESGDQLEVLSGLQAGDRIITNGQINITNGSAVQIVK